ncbi:hypothetical protein HMPREF9019_2198 [Hoylesella timonensis CRIS 5C-B1]|uniref:Uncharacterized protein n=1 Tax=Hoylesella timonensis CRIS 5C-B1 TaxID=679189 RepID=D1VWS3_9BACT|nr:hypothetical protein HMPREF9019_2198 [Hoylesella timonensis CRIS 5C-B1]
MQRYKKGKRKTHLRPFFFSKQLNIAHHRYHSTIEESYFYNEEHPQYSIYNVMDTLYWRIINAEFSLQSASQNSHENIQQQSWSQICEL